MKMRMHVLFALVVLLGVGSRVWAAARDSQVQTDTSISPAVANALLAEDWKLVAELLTDDTCKASPVARLIKGHACLALNRNNESLCLFLSASSEADLRVWEAWTASFAAGQARSANAQYLAADALARLMKWDGALAGFKQALAVEPKHALALIGRGAALAATGEWDSALLNFEDAAAARPGLADAHASLGTMWVQRRTGARGALEAFDRALVLSPDFALALNGRGCARIALGRWEDALGDFKAAAQKTACFNIPVVNLASLGRMREDFVKRSSARGTQLPAGMSANAMNRYVNSLNPVQARQSFGQADWNRRWSTAWAGIGDFISSFSGRISSTTSGQLGIRTPATLDMPGINAGLSGSRSMGLWTTLRQFGQNLASTSRNDAAYWNTFRNQIGTRFQINQMVPGGVTAEDLEHAFVDSGNWLDTGYGLAYRVEPVRPAAKDGGAAK